jgi:hypothetical protein
MYRLLSLFLILSPFLTTLHSQERNLLENAISKEELAEVLVGIDAFNPHPMIGHQSYLSIDKEQRELIISRGEKYLNYKWPSLSALTFMDFDINGNRTKYEGEFFNRRNVISYLTMAEILENKGRFIEDIIDGVWLVLEETTWVIPAHSGGDKLHDNNDVTVDLFSAETAAQLAWVYYFLGDQLDQYTPLITKRIKEEVERRVIVSMLEHNDFWYMGFTGRIPNNWNPWIVSNWLTAVLILEEDQETRVESVWKSLRVLDNFLNPYPADGGCDEGPGYWGHAGASLYDCLQQLHASTNGAIDIFDNELIKGIGQYIYKIHIGGNWYTNFADGSAKLSQNPGTIYRFGKAINDEVMMAFGSNLYKQMDASNFIKGRSSFGLRTIPDLLIANEMAVSTQIYTPYLNYRLPDLKVAVAREEKSEKGFFIAIKGGINNESHNHNDAGNFIVYYDGLPLFIDAGVGDYTAKTFSSERYSIWTMQSAYHNLPSLNGVMQSAGDTYMATGFHTEDKKGIRKTSMNLEEAYPESSFTESWTRTLILDRKKSEVSLNDTWIQTQQSDRNLWHFMCAYEPEILEKGVIKVSNGVQPLYLSYDKNFFPDIEKIEIQDYRLGTVWGDAIWRITLTIGLKGLNGSQDFIIKTAY